MLRGLNNPFPAPHAIRPRASLTRPHGGGALKKNLSKIAPESLIHYNWHLHKKSFGPEGKEILWLKATCWVEISALPDDSQGWSWQRNPLRDTNRICLRGRKNRPQVRDLSHRHSWKPLFQRSLREGDPFYRHTYIAVVWALGNTCSRTVTEVKQSWAWLVLGWETPPFKCCLSVAASP